MSEWYHELVKIYTRGGDDGSTALADGARVSKAARRVDAYGVLDELNAVIGVLRVENIGKRADHELGVTQSSLFEVGSRLADPLGRFALSDAVLKPQWLEAWIDAMEAKLPPLHNFVLPAGSRAAAYAHLARTVCRRAEREVVALGTDGVEVATMLPFLNRLSDALFVLARWLNRRWGASEVLWRGRN